MVEQTLVQVALPEMGESVSEGTVTSWLKKVGETVSEGEPLAEITTDKVDVELPSPVAGRIVRLLAAEGENVTVGSPLAEIDVTEVPSQPAAVPTAGRAEEAAAARPPVEAGGPAAPSVRKLAREHGVELARVRGSGEHGRITAGDVLAASTGKNGQTSAPEHVTPLKGPAATLAGYMEQSLSIPTATSFRTMPVEVLEARRRELNDALHAAGRREKASFTHLIAFAIVRAVATVPAMAHTFRRTAAGTPERVAAGVNLGIAVDVVRKDGARFLMVPVLRGADRLDFGRFHGAYEELIAKARTNSLQADDLVGATITLTNPGGIGTVASVPRLMPGQGTIVAAGAIGYPPGLASMPAETLRALGASKVMTLSSTYDHRIIQGAESGEFLRRIDQLLGGAGDFYESVFTDMGLPRPGAPRLAQATALGALPAAGPAGAAAGEAQLRAAALAAHMVLRYRTHGHTAADLDPLQEPGTGDPVLEPANAGTSWEELTSVPASVLNLSVPGRNAAEALESLKRIYTGTMAYEVEHLTSHEERSWLREQIETGAHCRPLRDDEWPRLLERLTRVEAFERYLRRTFLGKQTFSIEGLDALVPMLAEALEMYADQEIGTAYLGMAHRGRLATITHIAGAPYEDVLTEFELVEKRGEGTEEGRVTGDVPVHLGAEGEFRSPSGKRIHVVLPSNPSHLEAVDPVVEGETRATQTDRSAGAGRIDRKRAVAILIHGDAAFVGQGVVAETINLSRLAGYDTGGTLHVIGNNQVGFTTDPDEGRSTRYASDLAKGFDIPVIHVNADDIEAAIYATRLAVDFRQRFRRDVVIDLIGYRRFGHNEADEPAYTQPLMYELIAKHPTARDLYVRKLIGAGLLTEELAKSAFDAATKRLSDAHKNVKANLGSLKPRAIDAVRASGDGGGVAAPTRVSAEALGRLNEALLTVPEGFTIHPKLVRQLERRKGVLESGGELDWGLGEALAFASLLTDGVPIRLTGQDTERGTFSHRHLVFHDAVTGERYAPIQHLPNGRAAFEVHNSPLTEYACLGFEYGYSVAVPDALVLWEAQYGDFVNGAQIIVDQYVVSARSKWGMTSRLTMLLPHGYEGSGPEHSSARLERFLQLAAEGSIRVANCSTPAQYFHLLRDQALSPKARPLVVITPKSLLRLKAATSTLADLTEGSFQPVVDDPSVGDRAAITRLILCSGKIYYDLTAHAARAEAKDLAIVRVELLEPFPFDSVLKLVESYPQVKSVAWVQEEPRNQGARAFVSRRLREHLLPRGIGWGYVGRPDRSAPSEGYAGAHQVEQERIVSEALGTKEYRQG